METYSDRQRAVCTDGSTLFSTDAEYANKPMADKCGIGVDCTNSMTNYQKIYWWNVDGTLSRNTCFDVEIEKTAAWREQADTRTAAKTARAVTTESITNSPKVDDQDWASSSCTYFESPMSKRKLQNRQAQRNLRARRQLSMERTKTELLRLSIENEYLRNIFASHRCGDGSLAPLNQQNLSFSKSNADSDGGSEGSADTSN